MTKDIAIDKMTTAQFRERLIDRILANANEIQEGSLAVQERVKSVERMTDRQVEELQDMETLEMVKERTPKKEGGAFPDLNKDGKVTQADILMGRGVDLDRDQKQEGGSMLVPPEMEMTQDMSPVDTYDNISPEEEAMTDMKPDDEMETDYVEYVLENSLTEEEQDYLISVLDQDERLNDILDKVLLASSEFRGDGEVEGPGTGISDDIPARLSDGEFVITKKATDQIGADNLQQMMDQAERASDEGREDFYLGGLLDNPAGLDLDEEDDIEKQVKTKMVNADRMPSIRG